MDPVTLIILATVGSVVLFAAIVVIAFFVKKRIDCRRAALVALPDDFTSDDEPSEELLLEETKMQVVNAITQIIIFIQGKLATKSARAKSETLNFIRNQIKSSVDENGNVTKELSINAIAPVVQRMHTSHKGNCAASYDDGGKYYTYPCGENDDDYEKTDESVSFRVFLRKDQSILNVPQLTNQDEDSKITISIGDSPAILGKNRW